jgi:hypothetical protein
MNTDKMMTHPLALIPAAYRPRVFAFFLVLTLLVMAALNILGGPLQTAAAPAGIVSYEFSGDTAGANTILNSWDNLTRQYAALNLGLDYLFMPAYATTIGLACIWVGQAIGGRTRSFAIWLAWGQWLAAVLDAIENAALLKMLLDTTAAPWPPIAYWCAAVKFGLVLLGLLFAAVGTAYHLLGRSRRPVANQAGS